jgi:NitT/TauT family transport system ATP-binding protein
VTSVVAASHLGLTFPAGDGDIVALNDVNLTIEKGEFVSFIGPSGCGKTTFLRAIADLEKPTSGTLTVNGQTPENARKDRSYGYVFQAAALYPWRTIEKNVALPLEIMGYSASEQAERVRRTMELVNLAGFEKKYPWQLSGGMQQRASIARALAFDADLLLMDEPFGALDEIVRDHLNSELLKLWDRTQQDHLLRDPLHPGGGVSLDQDRGDVARVPAGSRMSSRATCPASARSIFARRRNFSPSPPACATGCAPGIPMRRMRYDGGATAR